MRQSIVRCLGIIGLLGALAGCQSEKQAQAERAQQAAQQFAADRGGGAAGLGQMRTIQGDPAADGMAFGEISAIDGATITLAGPGDGTTTTVEIAEGAPISQTAELRLEEIAIGEQITAFGQTEGAELQAMSIQVGASAGPLIIGAPPEGGPGGATGALPAGDGSVAAAPAGKGDVFSATAPQVVEPVSGSVARIENGALVIKEADGGETTVRLAPGGTIQKQVAADRSALQAGQFVIAHGAQADGVFRASSLEIMPKPGQ